MPSAVMPVVGVEQRDDLRQRGEALAHGGWIVGRHDHGQARRLVDPAPRIAGRVAAERRRRSPSVSARARGSSDPAARRGCACASAATIRASVFGPMPGTSRSRPSRGRLAAARRRVEIPSAAPISIMRCAPSPSRRPSATSSSGVERRSSASSAISPVSTSSRSRASMPRPIPRSSRTRPCRTSDATGTGAARIELRRAPVGARAVGIRLGELEQRRQLVQPPRDQGVVDRGRTAIHAPVVPTDGARRRPPIEC